MIKIAIVALAIAGAAGLPDLFDRRTPELMTQLHVPGTALAVVSGGQTILLRGYGVADVDARTAVDPRRTAFRAGSVAKVFTAVAALKLVDQGAS